MYTNTLQGTSIYNNFEEPHARKIVILYILRENVFYTHVYWKQNFVCVKKVSLQTVKNINHRHCGNIFVSNDFRNSSSAFEGSQDSTVCPPDKNSIKMLANTEHQSALHPKTLFRTSQKKRFVYTIKAVDECSYETRWQNAECWLSRCVGTRSNH